MAKRFLPSRFSAKTFSRFDLLGCDSRVLISQGLQRKNTVREYRTFILSYLEFIKAISLIGKNLAPTSFDATSSLRNLAKVLISNTSFLEYSVNLFQGFGTFMNVIQSGLTPNMGKAVVLKRQISR
jgi:hypothetical protein